MRIKKRVSALVFILIFSGTGILSCVPQKQYNLYLDKDALKNKKLVRLFQLLDGKKNEDEIFSVIEQIIYLMRKDEKTEGLNLFLSDFIGRNPQDPYLAYYLLTLGTNCKEKGDIPMAVYYFRRVLKETQDLYIGGSSIHLVCLKEIIQYGKNPDEVIECYEKILNQFSDTMEPGYCYYNIARQYEKTGHWNEAINYYRKYLIFPATSIPDNPNAYEEVQRKVRYYEKDIYWAYDDLDELISRIEYAVNANSGYLLNRYKADYFFIMSWMQETTDGFTHVGADLSSYLTKSTRLNDTVEPFSNDHEAYLRSWGWSYQYQVGVFYLYFRRIDLPENPDINGKWEWAGIYLGERR